MRSTPCGPSTSLRAIHPANGATSLDVGLPGGRRPARPARRRSPRDPSPAPRHHGTAPTAGTTGTNVTREPSGGPLGSGKRRTDGLEVRSPHVARRRRGRRGGVCGGVGPGPGLGRVAGATTNGPGPQRGQQGDPQKGGWLVFGVDAEESGFDPTTARFDEVGVMYARTVFDPLTIILANGDWAPYLAESVVPNASYTSWTITLRPNLVFHDGTPCNGAALVTNLEAQAKSLLTGVVISPTLVGSPRPGPWRYDPFKSPWIPSPTTWPEGSAGRSPMSWRLHAGQPQRDHTPRRYRALRVPGMGPQRPLHGNRQPELLAPGPALPVHHLQAIPDEEAGAPRRSSPGTIDLMITDTPQIITQFRGNKSYSYIDDSTHVAGEPDMNCVQLNCLASRRSTTPRVRRAAAMADQP